MCLHYVLFMIIAALVLASGFFSVFEQALKEAKRNQLQKEAEGSGSKGRAARYGRALKAAEKPNRYFALARFWIWSLRIFASVLTGICIAPLTEILAVPLLAAAVTAALFAASLLFGEILPRIITNRNPEQIAAALLPVFNVFALPVLPLYLLSKTAAGKLRPLFSHRTGNMTEEELHLALVEGEKSGIVESKELTMVEGVFYLGDRPLGTFMTHRRDIQWLDINAPMQDIRAKAMEHRTQHCFPVADGTLDAIIGAAYIEDIILDYASESPAGLKAVIKKALLVPETMPALKAFESFRRTFIDDTPSLDGEGNFLFVMDEYGGFAGMISVRNLMEEIVGELAAPRQEEKPAVQQEDGSWLASGGMNVDDAAELFSLPSPAPGDYHTLAGFVLSLAGELPCAGDSFLYQGCRFTVLEMDGNRINKISVNAALPAAVSTAKPKEEGN
jgi:putative hemolysin